MNWLMSQNSGQIWTSSGKQCLVRQVLPKHLSNFRLFSLALQGCLAVTLCHLCYHAAPLNGLHKEAPFNRLHAGTETAGMAGRDLSQLAQLSQIAQPRTFQQERTLLENPPPTFFFMGDRWPGARWKGSELPGGFHCYLELPGAASLNGLYKEA